MLFEMQRLIMSRAISVFGFSAARNKRRNALRFLEEALELVAATRAVDLETALRLVQHVYTDHPGDLTREAGHCFNNLLALCDAHEISATSAQLGGFAHFIEAPLEKLHLSEATKIAEGF